METPKNNWYKALVNEINSVSEELGLDDMGTDRLRDFVVERAKDQFKAGNKSGIRWAFEKARKEGVPPAPVRAAA